MWINNNRLFFEKLSAQDLVQQFGSPLFVYEERVLRERCRELVNLVSKVKFRVNFSTKANNNVALLKIIREEGLKVDAMSPGEIYLEQAAGFRGKEILYIGNNVSKEELRFAIDNGALVSVDSLDQLAYFGEINPGGDVFVRINPGIGEGHHSKVITAGKAKFGVDLNMSDEIKNIATRYNLKIIGLNMHIGSFFLTPDAYLEAIKVLLEVASGFEGLSYLDFGGGLGIPYQKDTQKRFPMAEFGEKLQKLLLQWQNDTGNKQVTFIIEPGRYPVAECCTILTTVQATKENFGCKYIGTDLGFNVLMRPVLYGSYHEVLVCNNVNGNKEDIVDICGNICESGDLIAEQRPMPRVSSGDILAVLDSGAYGFSMSSNYNARLRPAEVLISPEGKTRIIRKREEIEYVLLNQVY